MEEGEQEGKSKIGPIQKFVQGTRRLLLWEDSVPLEDISPETVAKTILDRLGNPVLERFKKGDYWENPFSIADVLVNMGHLAVWSRTDYSKKFPEEYKRTRDALNGLVRDGALEQRFSEKPDLNNETAYYKVVNEGKLKEVAQPVPAKT